MNILTRYECACCKTQYADRDAALKCELNHKHPVTIEAARYRSIGSDAPGYPISIIVKMNNGRGVVYERVREA